MTRPLDDEVSRREYRERIAELEADRLSVSTKLLDLVVALLDEGTLQCTEPTLGGGLCGGQCRTCQLDHFAADLADREL